MIGRTEYHNVAGTRCATDFVEFPSILMEHFLSGPIVQSYFDSFLGTTSSNGARSSTSNLGGTTALETYTQIYLAALDQTFHSSISNSDNFSTTTALANLHKTEPFNVIPYVQGTAPQLSFTHLFGYGASYYSYLFDRAIAAKVWRHLFAEVEVGDDAHARNGRRLKGVLGFGGGKDPWELVSTLIEGDKDAETVALGNQRSMEVVGKWGIGG
jgi:intermediate peptidase